MSDWKDYLGTAGDMASGSQNPEEQNDWLEKQQKEQERQRKALERQQQRLMNPGNSFTATPTGLTGETGTTENRLPGFTPANTGRDTGTTPAQPDKTTILNIDFSKKIDDPLGKLPSREVNRQLHDKYSDGHLPRDWAGRPLPPAEARSAIEKWQANLHDMSHDMREIHFLMSYENSPVFREKANRAIHELNRIMPELKGQVAVPPNADTRFPVAPPVASSDASGGNRAARTTDPGQRTTSSADLGQIASVNHPVDQSMNPLLEEAIAYVRKRLQNPTGKPADDKPAGNSRPSVMPVSAPHASGKPSPAEPFRPVASSSVAEQIAHIYDPQDQSMTPFYDRARDALEQIMGKTVVGHEDESAMPAYRMAGEAIKNAAENALNKPGKVNAWGNEPPGHQDESDEALERAGFRTMNHQAVADAQELMNEKEGYTYDRDLGTVEADALGTGFKIIPVKAKIGLYSLAATVGRMIHDIFGGDPVALEKTEADLVRFQRELDNLKPMTANKIWVKDHPEETGKNLTRYLYQQLGNQTVMLPAAYLLSKVEGIAAITGISATMLTAQINAGIIRARGKGDPYTAAMYGIPLGMMTLLKIPFKAPVSFQNPQELKAWLQSVLVDFGVNTLQEEGANSAVKGRKDLDQGNQKSAQ